VDEPEDQARERASVEASVRTARSAWHEHVSDCFTCDDVAPCVQGAALRTEYETLLNQLVLLLTAQATMVKT
jgi:hypothetical protein